MSSALVGYTGFVGSNLMKSNKFDRFYNSSNIGDAQNTCPELLVYAGVRAEKYMANQKPEEDSQRIQDAIKNIELINPKKLILISTIDVYNKPEQVDEDSIIDSEKLQPYGYNRYRLEQWVENNIRDYVVLRLPGLYGDNLKKNFIFDYLHKIPMILSKTKYYELCSMDSNIARYYEDLGNGFFHCAALEQDMPALSSLFENIGFSALNFTDSRGCYQFYNLAYLWEHIQIIMDHGINKINISTEPVRISELYRYICGKDFINEIHQTVPAYNFKTKYARLFHNNDGYIFDKKFVLNDINRYIKEHMV